MAHPKCASTHRRGGGGERGAAAVEFALILAILLPIVFGIINFGFAMSDRQAVSQAAAEGARAAAVNIEPDETDKAAAGRAAIDDALDTQGLSCDAGCEVVVDDCSAGSAERCAFATASVDVDPLIPGFSFGLGGPMSYTASARVS